MQAIPSQALYQYLVNSSCGDLLRFCEVSFEKNQYGHCVIIHCRDGFSAIHISKQYQGLVSTIVSVAVGQWEAVILRLKGQDINIIPLRENFLVSNMMIASTKAQIPHYQGLLELACSEPEYATYVTLVPTRDGQSVWEWGKPIECILASDGVSKFSSRQPFKFHRANITRLYDRQEMERQMLDLTREFRRSPRDRVVITDYPYETYLSDPHFEDELVKSQQKGRYLADLEMMFVENVGLIRICRCKQQIV
jgi:hypothetical protein